MVELLRILMANIPHCLATGIQDNQLMAISDMRINPLLRSDVIEKASVCNKSGKRTEIEPNHRLICQLD